MTVTATTNALRAFFAADPAIKVTAEDEAGHLVIHVTKSVPMDRDGVFRDAFTRAGAHDDAPKWRDMVGIAIVVPVNASHVAGYRDNTGYAWSRTQWAEIDRQVTFADMAARIEHDYKRAIAINERETARARAHPLNIAVLASVKQQGDAAAGRASIDAYILRETGRTAEEFYRFSSSTRRDLRKQARAAMNGGPPMKRVGENAKGPAG